jgi:hypothetical protein
MSADEEITTIAATLEELARDLNEARAQRDQDHQALAATKTAVARANARLEVEGIGPIVSMKSAIKVLNERVDALAATLGTALDQGKVKAPHGPRWDNLDQDKEAAQLAQLREWVDGVLRVQYPGYKVPDCWSAHREALWELGALHAEWRRVFEGPRGVDLESMLWFHERWLPGTIGRLDKAVTKHADGTCRAHAHRANGRREAGR